MPKLSLQFIVTFVVLLYVGLLVLAVTV